MLVIIRQCLGCTSISVTNYLYPTDFVGFVNKLINSYATNRIPINFNYSSRILNVQAVESKANNVVVFSFFVMVKL